MNHRVFGKKLHRTKKLRERLFRSLVINFLKNGKLTTTQAKAFSVRAEIEKIVTRAKKGDAFSRRFLLSKLNSMQAVDQALKTAELFKDLKGGYLKMLKLPNRRGDNSKQAILLWSKEPQETQIVQKDSELKN